LYLHDNLVADVGQNMWVSRDGIRGYIDLEGKALCFHIWPESNAYKE